jgi:hypothetical protein
MFIINTQLALKIIILFALINSSIFIGFKPELGILRLAIAVLMNVSGVLLIIFFFKISKRKFDTNLYFKIMFFLLIGWSVYTVLSSFDFDFKILITLFGHQLMGWAWLTPLAVVFGFNINNWLMLFSFFAKLLFMGAALAFGSFFYPVSVNLGVSEWMDFLPIMLLTYFYQNKINRKIVIFASSSFLMLAIFSSQRASMVFLFLLIIFLIFEFYRYTEIGVYKKILSLLALIAGSVFFVLQLNSFVVENEDLKIDTRTFLFIELFADMSNEELITGRGALGSYYSPYFAHTEEQGLLGDSSTRVVNEVGYLEIILKGGYVMATLYLLILLPAAYLGIFKSNNVIARMSGYFILIYLILWVVSFYPIYSAGHILLWMAAGTAISPTARNIKNRDLLIKRNKEVVFDKQYTLN